MLQVDYFEFDLHMTADDILVLSHDATLDRVSDAAAVFGAENVLVRDKTLAELKQLNMAAQFVNDAGETPYADLHGDAVPDELRILVARRGAGLSDRGRGLSATSSRSRTAATSVWPRRISCTRRCKSAGPARPGHHRQLPRRGRGLHHGATTPTPTAAPARRRSCSSILPR